VLIPVLPKASRFDAPIVISLREWQQASPSVFVWHFRAWSPG
jgi:hypothetical protein